MDWGQKLRKFLGICRQLILSVAKVVTKIYDKIWGFLQLKVPFLRALVNRHVHNPSTVMVDLAIFVLGLYLIFGVVAFIKVYTQKSESRFTETISNLYPLPAAKINSSFVWSHKFLERLRFINTFNDQAPQDENTPRPPTDQELRQRVLEGLIEDKVIYLEARKRGLKVTKEELEIAFSKQGEASEIAAKIKQLYGMNLAQFKRIIAEQVLKEKVKDAVLGKVRVRHILTLDLPSAQEAKRRLDAGADFVEIVREFSQDSQTAENGGDLGFWRKGELASRLAPIFENTVDQLEVNQISSPTQSQFGYHIIQVTERLGDNLQTYEQWYAEVIKEYSVKKYLKI